eukprot:SAG31_NODE_252_length_19068_cov_18.307713_9_plen_153_part_00
MMYHSVIKKYRYHIRWNVYQLYKIRRHGMAMHPGALDIDDVARARPAPNQLLAATPTLTMVVLCTATLTGLLLYADRPAHFAIPAKSVGCSSSSQSSSGTSQSSSGSSCRSVSHHVNFNNKTTNSAWIIPQSRFCSGVSMYHSPSRRAPPSH